MECSLNKSFAEELVVEYAAGTLGEEAHADFARHMQSCASCRALLAQQSAVWSALDEWQPVPASADFDRTLTERIARVQRPAWWSSLAMNWVFRPLVPVLAVAGAVAVLACAFLLRKDVPVQQPAETAAKARIELQVEHALDDMDLLKQIGVDVASEMPRAGQKI